MYFFGKSDIGKKRATNQDAFRTVWLYDNCCLLVICDGMGGASGGNIASELAIKFFTEGMKTRLAALRVTGNRLDIDPIARREELGAMLQHCADRANAAVFARASEDERLAGMGTTLVAALVIDTALFVINIGDSRLYHIGPQGLRQITKDHSYLQYLLDSGQITKGDPEGDAVRNVITRSIGTEEQVSGDITLMSLTGEGFVLLCSDGLSGYVAEETMLSVICQAALIREETDNDYELEDKVDHLIDLANEAGGFDNITAILLKYTRNDTEGGQA